MDFSSLLNTSSFATACKCLSNVLFLVETSGDGASLISSEPSSFTFGGEIAVGEDDCDTHLRFGIAVTVKGAMAVATAMDVLLLAR